ncbi:MAG: hypothetical protein ABI589_13690 [Burkholderiales bacterium]
MTLTRVAFAALGSWALSSLSAVAPVPAPDAGDECIPPVSYFALDPSLVGADGNGNAAIGSYERISPDGRFVLRSYSGRQLGEVSLIELPNDVREAIRAYATPLSNEAFPVQGSWRYLVDVNGDHYRFADVVRQGRDATPLFRGGMTGFYAAASEMSAREEGASAQITIRSLSWPQTSGVEPGGAQGSGDPGGTGPLQIRTIRVLDDGVGARIVQDSGARYVCTSRSLVDGNLYSLPMISIDGREFSAVPQAPKQGAPTMRVYGLSAEPFATDHACQQRIDFGHTPAKAVFGFSPAAGGQGEAAALTFTDNASVYFYDRGVGPSGTAFLIDDLKTSVLASAFPGLTRDGRIVFGATWKDCPDAGCRKRAGYAVADPYQSAAYKAHWNALGEAPPKSCITHAEAMRERAAFALRLGLPDR